jgi:hypothetical protein
MIEHRPRVALAASLALCASLAAAPSTSDAFCGFYVAGSNARLLNRATMVVLMRDGARTVLSMQNTYEGPPEDFALVIPVPVVLSRDNVRTLPKDVFDRVDQVAAPRLVEYWEQDPCPSPERGMGFGALGSTGAGGRFGSSLGGGLARGNLGVRVEARFEVGEYDVVILSARDSSGLDTWLRQERYHIPEGAEPLLAPYVRAGMKFFVAKVNAQRVRFEQGRAQLSPLRFHYDSESFALPVRLGLMNSPGAQDLVVHVLSPSQRFEAANRPNVTIPTNLDVNETVKGRFAEFYAALFDRTLERNPGAVVTEYAWSARSCDPCPVPPLTDPDLATLGADVLPSTAAVFAPNAPMITGLPRVRATLPQVRGPMNPEVIRRVVLRNINQRNFCYEQAIVSNPALAGQRTISFTIDPQGAVTESTIGRTTPASATLDRCLANAVRRFRFPADAERSTVALPLSLTLENPGLHRGFRPRLPAFVLTRLHARYGRELSDDLVFREAQPIQGGRERRDPTTGSLEQGAQSSLFGENNFQARYAIRHPWTGPIACANPRRGVWGGPPPGVEGSTTAQAARGLAFAPRGAIQLDRALGPASSAAATADAAVPHHVDASVTAAPNAAAPRGRLGCSIANAPAPPAGAPAALFVWAAAALSALVRKRPRDQA